MIQKTGNTRSGSLKNETENSHNKAITKCDRSLLQSVIDCYYKVRQVFKSLAGCYYKVSQVLQSET